MQTLELSLYQQSKAVVALSEALSVTGEARTRQERALQAWIELSVAADKIETFHAAALAYELDSQILASGEEAVGIHVRDVVEAFDVHGEVARKALRLLGCIDKGKGIWATEPGLARTFRPEPADIFELM